MDLLWDEAFEEPGTPRQSCAVQEVGATQPVLSTLHSDATILVLQLQIGSEAKVFRLSAEDSIVWWHKVFSVFDEVLAAHTLTKHHLGWPTRSFCASAGVNEPLPYQANVAVQCALELVRAASRVKLPDGSTLPVGIGIDSGVVRDGLIGSPGNLKYHLVGCPVSLAAQLACRAPANSILVSAAAHSRMSLPCKLHFVGRVGAGLAGTPDCYLTGSRQVATRFIALQAAATMEAAGGTAKSLAALTSVSTRAALECTATPTTSCSQEDLRSAAQHEVAVCQPSCSTHQRSLQGTFNQTLWLQFQDDRLESRFTEWYADCRAPPDGVVALLYAVVGAARSLWLSALCRAAGRNTLTPLFLLLPLLLASLCTLLLQATGWRSYCRHRGVVAGALRVYQTVFLLGASGLSQGLAQASALGPWADALSHNAGLVLGLQSLLEMSLFSGRAWVDATCLGLVFVHGFRSSGTMFLSAFTGQAMLGLAVPAALLFVLEKRARSTFQRRELTAKKLA